MGEEIGEWSKALIEQIERHARVENERLEKLFGKQMRLLEAQKKQALVEASVHEEEENTEELQQFLYKCVQLKFELMELGSFKKSIRVIVETKEDPPPVLLIPSDQSSDDVELQTTVDTNNGPTIDLSADIDSLERSNSFHETISQ